MYPTVSNYFNSLHQSKVVSHYSDALEKMDEAQKQAAIDAAVQYNTLLVSMMHALRRVKKKRVYTIVY